MLYILNYTDSSIYLGYILTILEILFLITAINVILTKNPIISVLFLIILFLFVSIYLIIIGTDFLGISYLLVYIGAVSILFLFILMLIDIRVSELYIKTTNSIIAVLFLGAYFIYVLYNNTIERKSKDAFKELEAFMVDQKKISHENYEGSIVDNFDIIAIGNIIYTNLSFLLIISLLILLLSMIGSIVINLDSKYK